VIVLNTVEVFNLSEFCELLSHAYIDIVFVCVGREPLFYYADVLIHGTWLMGPVREAFVFELNEPLLEVLDNRIMSRIDGASFSDSPLLAGLEGTVITMYKLAVHQRVSHCCFTIVSSNCRYFWHASNTSGTIAASTE
jgi:hypothetical protein